jgi:hypothetical protein
MTMPKDTVSVEIKGLKELEQRLLQMSRKMANATGKDAALAMGKLLQRAERDKAPVYDGDNPGVPAGFMAKHILCTRPKIIKNSAVVLVGPDPNTDYPDYNGAYKKKKAKNAITGRMNLKNVGRISVAAVAWFIERGFKHKIGGKHVPARPFIVPALIATADKTVDECVKKVREGLDEFGLRR